MRAWRAKVREKKEALEGNSKLEVMKLEIVPVANPPWDGTEPCTTAPDKNIFHGQNHPEIREAKTYCEVCPIKQECLDYAMAVMEDGVYGGTTFGEREKIRRRRM